MASGLPATIASRSASVDAHEEPRALLGRPGALEKIQRGRARCILSLRHNRIFQIDDHAICAAGHGLIELGVAVRRYEQKRAHHFGRIRMKAWR